MTAFEGFPQPVPVWPAEGPAALATDMPCRKCQYNLRGLSVDGRCPECGTPVGLSARGDFLRYSDPAWVATLRVGVLCMLWSIAAAIAGGVLGAVARSMTGSRVLAMLFPLGGTVLSLIGAWLLTTPDPSGLGEDQYGTSRKLIRVTLAVAIVGDLVQFAQQSMNSAPAVALALVLVAGAVTLVGVVGKFATLNYLGKLARRLPDYELAGRANVVMYGYGIPLGVLVVIGAAMAVMGRGLVRRPPAGGPPVGLIGLGCAAGLCGLVLLVFAVMYLFMLIRFAKAFGEQAAIARATWAVEVGAGRSPA